MESNKEINNNGFEYVDLGLPSGTLWAEMNVGASKASEAGLYFRWGDAQGYSADQIGNGEGQKKFSEDYSDYKWYLSGSIDENNLKFKKENSYEKDKNCCIAYCICNMPAYACFM